VEVAGRIVKPELIVAKGQSPNINFGRVGTGMRYNNPQVYNSIFAHVLDNLHLYIYARIEPSDVNR